MNQIAISEEQLEKLSREGLKALVNLLFAEIKRRNARIAELDAQSSSRKPPATSYNSSQPPTLDQEANLGENKSQMEVGAKPCHKAALRSLVENLDPMIATLCFQKLPSWSGKYVSRNHFRIAPKLDVHLRREK